MKPTQKKSNAKTEAFLNVVLSAKACKKLSLKKAIRTLGEIGQAIFESDAVCIGQSKVWQLSGEGGTAEDFAALMQARALLIYLERVFSGKTLDNLVATSMTVNQKLN
jgi:hypothetical protein